jgi:hypothetical protein
MGGHDLFPCRGGSRLGATVPRASYVRVHSSLAFASSEFLRSNLPLGIFRSELVYPGFRPSSRHHRGASTERGGCHASTMVPSRAFTALRRVAPPSGFASLFRPAATSRVVAVQGLLSPCSRSSSSEVRSPLSFSSRSLTGCPAASRGRLDFEALIHTRPRSLRFGVSLPASRSPLRFSVSSRSSPTAFDPDYSGPSAHDVDSGALHAGPPRPSAASFDSRLGSSVSFRTNLPETLGPSVRGLHGDPVRRGPLRFF